MIGGQMSNKGRETSEEILDRVSKQLTPNSVEEEVIEGEIDPEANRLSKDQIEQMREIGRQKRAKMKNQKD